MPEFFIIWCRYINGILVHRFYFTCECHVDIYENGRREVVVCGDKNIAGGHTIASFIANS